MQDYNTIIGVIQLRQNNCSFSVIEARYHIGSGTAQRILNRFDATGFTLDELRAMEPHAVEDLIYPPQNLLRKDIPMPDFQHYYDRIHAKGSKVNISYCWIEYKQEHPDGYEQSQFYEYYNRFVEKTMVCAVLLEFPAVIEKQKNKEHWMYCKRQINGVV
jgi:hypothetical protein